MTSRPPVQPEQLLPWAAPVAAGSVDAVVQLPGSKSMTGRALVLASLSDGPSSITRPLRARDTRLMAAALRALGAAIEDGPGGTWLVTPIGPGSGAGGGTGGAAGTTRRAAGTDIDCGLAGTVMRFVPPVAGLTRGDARFDGDPRARERPMAPLLGALRSLGVAVGDGGRGALPFTVHGTGSVPGGRAVLDASTSSQYVSALLLAGARCDKGVELVHEGPPVPSQPHIAMTIAMLRDAGVEVDDTSSDRWAVAPGPVVARDVSVEPDLSNAAPFLAAALVTGGRVHVPGWPARTTQAGDALRGLLTRMGARCELDAPGEPGDPGSDIDGLTVTGGAGIHGIDADLHDVGELTPVLAALAALADSPSHLYGIAHLRGHETDRLAALAAGLRGLGADVEQTDDGLRLRPAALHGGGWQAHDDHRMATAGAVIGLAVTGMEIDDMACTTKTMPDFPGLWAAMLRGGT